jgi:hypothetical protein
MRLYSVFDVESHSSTKNTILKEIESASGYQCTTKSFRGDYSSIISKTNWDKDPLVRMSWPYFLTKDDSYSFVNYLEERYGGMGTEWKVRKQWFNQYDPHSGSDHPWHTHSHPNGDLMNGVASVYYVELGDESLVTVLKDPETGEEVFPKVKEGQILTFDANILHKSPRNFSDTRKTVIAFNIEFL